MLKVFLKEQLIELEQTLDKETMYHIRTHQFDRFQCIGDISLMSFEWHDIKAKPNQSERIMICFSKEELIFICEGNRTYELINQIAKEGSPSEKVLCDFFVSLIKPDMDYLETLEENITALEDDLLTTSKNECVRSIVALRKELLKLKKYYEQLSTILEGLSINENNIISEDNIRHYKILNRRADRLYNSVNNLRDYVTQVREAYQARIDIEQNNLMKIFTVVSSVFMPLTLIVGWYGMNLQMPEYDSKWGYPCVIAFSVFVLIVCITYFKRRKWF